MRFLVDMNLSPRWVDFLAAAGCEAVHWMDPVGHRVTVLPISMGGS